VALGATTLVFAVGLTASLDRVHADFTRVAAVPIVVQVADHIGPGKQVIGPGQGTTVDLSAVRQTIVGWPGTAQVVGENDIEVHAAGVTKAVTVETYTGDATWTGFAMVSGRWYAAPTEVVASSYLLRQTGHRIGDTLTLTGDAGTRTVTVVGSFMD